MSSEDMYVFRASAWHLLDRQVNGRLGVEYYKIDVEIFDETCTYG